ncbi:unnamed protein product [Linum tenue]|uniref:Uncharacterized protein n=1 Tax=Linum tenue TaxID=586396 RepID=A0AAV0J2R8_9ROSI|nr:unnamed protein product [Linum tenue]
MLTVSASKLWKLASLASPGIPISTTMPKVAQELGLGLKMVTIFQYHSTCRICTFHH